MSTFDNAISIHPYLKVQQGQMEACKALLAQFIERVVSEDKCLYYNFTFNDDVLFCREAYRDADGVQQHLENVGDVFDELLKICELLRFEIHGPAAELEKLKPVLGDLNRNRHAVVIGYCQFPRNLILQADLSKINSDRINGDCALHVDINYFNLGSSFETAGRADYLTSQSAFVTSSKSSKWSQFTQLGI